MHRRTLSILIVVAAIALGAFSYLYAYRGGTGPATVPIGGPIQLTDQDGKPFDSASLDIKAYMVFFGFTNCPEVCPTTLSDIARAEDEIGGAAKELPTLFITVDPERDTPAVLKEYISNFDGKTIGLTGTPEQVAKAAKTYRVFYKKSPTSDGSYTMDHTAVLYLMGPKGEFKDIIAYNEEQSRYVEKIKRLVE